MNKKVYWIIGGVLLVSLIVGATVFISQKKYEWVEVKKGDIVEAIYGLGTVKTENKFEVKIGAISLVEKLYVHEGDRVEKGDRIVKFTDFKVVQTPIRGIVSYVAASEGEVVQPYQKVILIQDSESRYIEVSLEQEGVLKLKEGLKAIVIFEDFRNLKYIGSVSSIYSRDSEFIVQVEIPEMSPNILPGMTADVSVEVGQSKEVLLVPMSSISNGHLVRKRKGKKEKVEVIIGKVDESWAEVLSGDVKEGDFVLVKRHKK